MTKPRCTCSSDEEWEHRECPVHVPCDERCGAVYEPSTLVEALAAVEHWRRHGDLSGCSHAR